MSVVIHCHHSSNPISGEMKRIININKDVAGYFSDDVVEVELYSIRDYAYVNNKGRFTLSNKISKKHYIPNVPSLYFINDIYRVLVLFVLFLKYRPKVYIEEWSLPMGLNILKRLFKKCRVGLDIHGAAPEEYRYLYGKESKFISNQEAYSIREADFIICQSQEMKRHIKQKYGVENHICVYRCGVDCDTFSYNLETRRKIREELRYTADDVVFVYSGGMHPWQKVEDSLKLFAEYYKLYSGAKLLVLTKETNRFNDILSKVCSKEMHSAVTVMSLGFEEVPSYLNAADIAFLLRDNHIMNAVASPTKLSEYMACGLCVISTSVSERWLDDKGARYVFNAEKFDLRRLNDFIRSSSRSEIANYALQTLSLDMDRINVHKFCDDICTKS